MGARRVYGRSRTRALLIAVVGITLLPVFPGHSWAQPGLTHTPEGVIVRYEPGTSAGQKLQARSAADVTFDRNLLLPRTQLVEAGPGQSVYDAIATLESDPRILYAEPDYVDQLAAVPSDPLLSAQWGLTNTGQIISGPYGNFAGVPGADISAVAGWDIGRASPKVLTGVIDSGFTTDHPDLKNQLWTNPNEIPGNGIDDDGNGYVDDVHGWDFVDNTNVIGDGAGHGTHVAGIIGGTGNNGIGGSGVSWNANLLPLKACMATNRCPVSAQIDAIAYAKDQGAKVVNMSLGSTNYSQARRDAIASAWDTLFVVAAMNDNADNDLTPGHPCQDDQVPGEEPLPNLICVAASDYNDGRWGGSNYGLTSVDLAAPGNLVLSTWPTFENRLDDNFESGAVNFDWHDYATGSGLGVWERKSGIGISGSYGVADSISTLGNDDVYGTNETTTMTSLPINLGGRPGCYLSYRYWLNTQAVTGSDYSTGDVLYVEAKGQSDPAWTTFDRLSGSTGGTFYLSTEHGSSATLERFDPNQPVQVRFRFKTNNVMDIGKTGVRVDDVTVHCAGPSEHGGTYILLSGTSMATPFVSGIASIVRELNPGLGPAEVKAAVLAGTDPLPAFSTTGPTPVATGGRANLEKTLIGLDLTPPPEPELLAPARDAWVTAKNPMFKWTTEETDAIYALFIDEEMQDFATGMSSYPLSLNLSPGDHYWRVEASDHAGNVASSAVRHFTIPPADWILVKSKRRLRGHPGGTKVTLSVSGPGRINATVRARVQGRMKTVGKASKRAASAGTVRLKIKPNRTGRSALARRKSLRGKLRLKFAPANGHAAVTRTVTVRM